MSGGTDEDNIHQQKLSSIVDIHICGGCRAQFSDVDDFLLHKRQTCPILSLTPGMETRVPDHGESQFIQLATIQQSTSTGSPHSAHLNIAQPPGHEYLCSSLSQPSHFQHHSLYKPQQHTVEKLADSNEASRLQPDESVDSFVNLHNQLNSGISDDVRKIENPKNVYESHENYPIHSTAESNNDTNSADRNLTDVPRTGDSQTNIHTDAEKHINGVNRTQVFRTPEGYSNFYNTGDDNTNEKSQTNSHGSTEVGERDTNVFLMEESLADFHLAKGKHTDITNLHQAEEIPGLLHAQHITVSEWLHTTPDLLTKTSTSQIASGLVLTSDSEGLPQKSINGSESLPQLYRVIDDKVTLASSSRGVNIHQILTAAELSALNTDRSAEQVLVGHVQADNSNNKEHVIIRQPNLLQSDSQVLKNIQIGQRVAIKQPENGQHQAITQSDNLHALTVTVPSNLQHAVVHESKKLCSEQRTEPVMADIQIIQKQLKDISQQLANNADTQIINMLSKRGIPHEILNQVFSSQQQTLSSDIAQQSTDTVLQSALVSHTGPIWNQVAPQTISLEQLSQLSASLAQKSLPEKLNSPVVTEENHMLTGNKRSTGKGHRQKTIAASMTKPNVPQMSESEFLDSMNEEDGLARNTGLLDVNQLHPVATPEKQLKNGSGRQFSGGDVSFETQQTLKAMLKQNSQPAKTEVSQCKLKIHPLKTKIKSKSFSCNFDNCTYQSAYQKDLDRHVRIHTGERPYGCQFCEKHFNRKDKLKLHLRAHTGNKPYRCTQCNYCAADGSSLKKHTRIHSGERPFKCQVCPYASRNSSQLIIHLRTHTGDAPFQCPVCASHFKINSDLKRHLRIHTGEKPFQCEHCDYRCSIKGNLKSHIRIKHSGENNLKCESCDFTTSSRKLLREHLKEHDPEERLKCSTCGYYCSNSTALKNHFRTHSSEKPYKCDHCSYSTKQSGNVKLHIKRKHPDMLWRRRSKRSHNSSEKSQISESKTTISSSNVIRSPGHVRTKCAKAYKCTMCEAAFVREDSLRSHLRQHKVMANSSLSTALTVLRLQQPVINNPVTAPSQVIDSCGIDTSQVVSECSINFTDTVKSVSSLVSTTSSELQTVADTVSTTSSETVNDGSTVSQSGLVNTGVTLQDLLAAAGIAGNVPSSPYLVRSGQAGTDSSTVVDMAQTIPAVQPMPYMQLPSPDQPPIITQQNIQIPIIDFASGQIVTIEGQLTESGTFSQPARSESFTVANPSIALNADPMQLVGTTTSQQNYPLNLVARVMDTVPSAIEKNTHSMPAGPFQLMLPSGESVTATLLDQTPADTIHSSPSLNMPISAGHLPLVGSGSMSNPGMTLLSIPLHLLKNIATTDLNQGMTSSSATAVSIPSHDMTVVQEVVVDLCHPTEPDAGTGECQTVNK